MKIELSVGEVERVLYWFSRLQARGLSQHQDEDIRTKLEGHRVMPSDVLNNFDEFWERHHKRNGQVYQVVLQNVIGKAGKIDWSRFARNHPIFCDYWDKAGWRYCGETLMDWIDNGMNPPPPEEKRASKADRIAERR